MFLMFNNGNVPNLMFSYLPVKHMFRKHTTINFINIKMFMAILFPNVQNVLNDPVGGAYSAPPNPPADLRRSYAPSPYH